MDLYQVPNMDLCQVPNMDLWAQPEPVSKGSAQATEKSWEYVMHEPRCSSLPRASGPLIHRSKYGESL